MSKRGQLVKIYRTVTQLLLVQGNWVLYKSISAQSYKRSKLMAAKALSYKMSKLMSKALSYKRSKLIAKALSYKRSKLMAKALSYKRSKLMAKALS